MAPLDTALDLRPLDPEKDGVAFARCMYSVYGYSYLETVYFPERVKGLIEKGLLRSYVAVTPEGAGKGPARVDLIIDTPQRTTRLLLVSRVAAAKVSALLERRLPQDIEGRELLWLINNAWAHNP